VAPSYEEVERLARERLPPDVAEKWIKLLRPAARLRYARPGEAMVGEIGGQPSLPESAVWPEWEGHGPLAYVGSIDCGALARIQLDIPIPPSGRLAFFFIDYSPNSLVTYQDPQSLVGARIIYIPPGVRVTLRSTPPGITAYTHVNLHAECVATYPNFEHPVLIRAFRAPNEGRQEFLAHPVNDEAFIEALWDLEPGPRHQLGGYATPIQGPVEYEVAIAARGGKADRSDPRLEHEALDWKPLLQVDSDAVAGMLWGDVGMLYWMIQPTDLQERRFDAASFTWQCH
jgi:uncharacterized protein DUF1963